MRERLCRRRVGERALGLSAVVVLLAALVGAAVTAAPAAADTKPARLTVTAQKKTVKWGAALILNGVLVEDVLPPVALDQKNVQVQRSPNGSDPWTLVDMVTNDSAPYSSGAYTYTEPASRTYHWRMFFAGDAEWAPAIGTVVKVSVKPVLGKPSCPSRVKAKKKFIVKGSLKPRFKAGSKPVKITCQRYVKRSWRTFKTFKAAAANSGAYSKYSVRISIARKGKFRFVATTATTGSYAAAKSAYSRKLTVK
ncbi:MAG: hypothetical protein GX624_01640 [Actinobacteria bacterium]|nr:hypothetical protein [Actinomycetota bacterium]